MWTVTSDYVKGILTYFVEHKETGERKGSFAAGRGQRSLLMN